MSLEYRERVRRTPSVYVTMSVEEKHNQLDWCGISDDIIREQHPGEDIDAIVKNMGDADFAALHALVMKRYRNRKKKALQAAESTDADTDEEEERAEEEIEQETA